MKLPVLVLFANVVTLPLGKSELYRRYQLIRITVEFQDDTEWLLKMKEKLDFKFTTNSFMIRSVDVMVPSIFVTRFKIILEKRQLFYRVIRTDVHGDVDKNATTPFRRLQKRESIGAPSLTNFDYNIYHRYAGIQQWVSDIAAEYDFVKKFTIGTTYEGRDIDALKIVAPGSVGPYDVRPIAYIQGGINGKEWISPATVMYFTGKLLKAYTDGDSEVYYVLRNVDLHVVPCLNADGYVFSWTEDPTWSKNRQPNPGSACVGTDLNSNFDAFWDSMVGTTSNPCSEFFRGYAPLDSKETSAVDNHFKNLKETGRDTMFFIDWQSSVGLGYALYPWSYNSEIDATNREIQYAAKEMITKMKEIGNNPDFIMGSYASVFGPQSGTSLDYGFASTPNASFSYVLMLGNTIDYVMPPKVDEKILEHGEMGYHGLLQLLSEVLIYQRGNS